MPGKVESLTRRRWSRARKPAWSIEKCGGRFIVAWEGPPEAVVHDQSIVDLTQLRDMLNRALEDS